MIGQGTRHMHGRLSSPRLQYTREALNQDVQIFVRPEIKKSCVFPGLALTFLGRRPFIVSS